MEWEKIFADHISNKGSVSKIYKELTQLNGKNANNPTKSGQRTQIELFPNKTYKWQIGHKMVLNITIHRRNTSQYPSKDHFTHVKVAITKKSRCNNFKGTGEVSRRGSEEV